MANEFKHASVGTELTQAEYEGTSAHVLDSQAAGDIIYASSTSQLSRLGIGTAGKVLHVNSGASAPEWTAALTGVTSIYATDLIIGEDSQTAIDFGTVNEIDFKVDNANRLTLTSGALYPATNNEIDLGTSSLEFKDAYFDGTVTADAFAGPLTGNVTGNASGTAATVTGAAQTNITSLGTLTALTVDDVAINGKVMTMTGSTNDTAVFTVGTNGTLSIVTTDTAAAAANVQITADGTVDIDSAGVLTLDSGAAINIEPASGSAILLDGTISIDAGVVTGATSITSTAFVGDITGDVTGNADTATALASGRTIAMTGDVAWTSASFDGSGNVTGAGTIQSTAVESGMLNNNVISGQTEISSGLAAADELLYSDGGVLKKVGIDTLTSYLAGVNAGTVTATGLSDSSGVITLDIQNMTASTSIADADLVVVDDGANGTLRKMTRANFIESAALDSINIDGGAIDGAAIGANSASTIVGTTIDASTDFTIGDTIITNGTITDSSGLSIAAALDLGANTLTTTGSLQVRTIDYSDGDNAITIADGGGVTFAQDVTLADDKSITFGDEGQIIFSDVAPDTDHSATGIVIKGTLATGVTAGMALYLQADGTYDHADKDTEGHMPAVGVALEDAGSDRKILIYGVYVDASLSLTRGEELYVGDDGAVTHTVPGSGDFLQRVGVALTTTSVLFMPSLDVIEHA